MKHYVSDENIKFSYFYVANRWKFRYEYQPFRYSTSIFFSIWVFFHEHSRFSGQQRKGEGISLIPLYHFHPLHRRLDILENLSLISSIMLRKLRLRQKNGLLIKRACIVRHVWKALALF